MNRIGELAAEYLPEWRFDGSKDDPGNALAELFSDMFSQSIDRYNTIPQKLYTEFLNLLGVVEPDAVSASGAVSFQVHNNVNEPIPVPEGTLMYISNDTNDRVVYETSRAIEATPAKIKSVYFCDSVEGTIQKLDMDAAQPFFGPVQEKNLQRHRFAISDSEAFVMSGPGSFEIEITASNNALTEAAIAQMADPEHSVWKYLSNDSFVRFDRVETKVNRIVLHKENSDPMDADENGRVSVYLDMKNMTGKLIVDSIKVRSIPNKPVHAEEMICEDLPVDKAIGGYCFGKIPAPYDSFYIRSDEAFSKRGAKVMLRFDISCLAHSEVDTGPQYSFDRSIIDKNQAVRVQPDDVFVRTVVWEYFNGTGWTMLDVSGNKNPFSGQDEGSLELTFFIPQNIHKVVQTTEEGYFIRARVVDIENQFSAVPRYIVPFIKDIECIWDYSEAKVPDYLTAQNNGETDEIDSSKGYSEYAMTIFKNMDPWPRSMYFCFDSSPHGMPISLMFDIRGRVDLNSKISYEVWNGREFKRVPSEDTSSNLEHSGIVSLYIQDRLPEASMFSEKGCWMRMSLSSMADDGKYPVVGAVWMNTVKAVQLEHDAERIFSTAVEERSKKITLDNTPVLSCEIWVDEASLILNNEIEELTLKHPDSIKLEKENDTVKSCLVRWEQIPVINMAGPDDRVYELDPFTGEITFGNGICGKVPPVGIDNIHVHSSFGGGSRGNTEIGAVKDFLISIPRISGLENITAMTGGIDRMPRERIERYGNKRLRHRERVVSTRDFEELVSEKFSLAEQVKCFANTDEQGNTAGGHVCVVVKAAGSGNEDMKWNLCHEIGSYLGERCDCTLSASGRLHVRPSIEMTVNIDLTIGVSDISKAVRTQQSVKERLEHIIDDEWAKREIGKQIRLADIYSEISRIQNVSSVRKMFVEGIYYNEGRQYVIPIEKDTELEFITVVNGEHKVRIG